MPLNAHTGGFVAGTLVDTMMRKESIENIGENSSVLTRAGETQQWGVRSNEVVMTPASDNLYSFNGGDPFFTAGQPFYTIIGIRAIDPTFARR
ncbi:Ff.00g017670.m01.CDS01 [Fusarium sp. VM40]|nr:Ff.00g017670.m01.CDS01 [Fusarium sp. VM40]